MSKKEYLKSRIKELEERIKFTNSVSDATREGIESDLYELRD